MKERKKENQSTFNLPSSVFVARLQDPLECTNHYLFVRVLSYIRLFVSINFRLPSCQVSLVVVVVQLKVLLLYISNFSMVIMMMMMIAVKKFI